MRNSQRLIIAAVCTGLTLATASASPTIDRTDICYEGGPLLPNFTLNGSATLDGHDLVVTKAVFNQAGSIFYNAKLASSGDIHVALEMKITTPLGNQGADGMTFVMTTDPNGVHSIGCPGLGIAYASCAPANLAKISPSVVVELDTYKNDFDPNANHVGINQDGDAANHLSTFTPTFDMKSGTPFYVWVDYTGSNHTLNVFVSQTSTKPASPQLSTTNIDVAAKFGNQPFLMGFTGSTGGSWSQHEIVRFAASDTVEADLACCNTNADCTGNVLGPICDPVKHVCGACSASDTSACTGGDTACDLGGSSNRCIPACTANFGVAVSGACPTSTAGFCQTTGALAGSCVACNGDAGSGAAFACGNGAPTCSTTQGWCTFCQSNSDCSRGTCDTSTGACSACTGNKGSATAHPCDTSAPFCATGTGVCQTTCLQDSDCGTGNYCAGSGSANGCKPLVGPGQPVPGGTCTAAAAKACTAGVCDPFDNACSYAPGDGPCTASSQCRSGVCATSGANAGRCEQCTGTANCGGTSATPVCDTTTNRCVQCLSSSNCGGATPICTNQACVACRGDNGTTGADRCPAAASPYCDTSGACRGCTANSDCANGTHPGPICDVATGACGTACDTNADCAASNWCNSTGTPAYGGVCVPRIPNGQPLPSAAPISSTCNTANAAKVCVSGVCDATTKTCGLLSGAACTSGTQCQGGICNSNDGKCGLANGEGACTTATADAVCRSRACGSDGKCGLPSSEGDCTAQSASVVCRGGVCDGDGKCGHANGQGPCSVATAAEVCRSKACGSDGVCGFASGDGQCTENTATALCRNGTCDGDRKCGLGNGSGPCTLPNGGDICRSHVCDPDGKCGLATGDGPCTAATATTVCRSGVCDSDGKCGLAIGDGPCVAASADPVCRVGVCDTDSRCGFANGSGLCTSENAAALCRSGVCGADGHCGFANATGTCTAATAAVVCRSAVCDSDGRCGLADGDGTCTADTAATVCRSGTCGTHGLCIAGKPAQVNGGGLSCSSASQATLIDGLLLGIVLSLRARARRQRNHAR